MSDRKKVVNIYKRSLRDDMKLREGSRSSGNLRAEIEISEEELQRLIKAKGKNNLSKEDNKKYRNRKIKVIGYGDPTEHGIYIDSVTRPTSGTGHLLVDTSKENLKKQHSLTDSENELLLTKDMSDKEKGLKKLYNRQDIDPNKLSERQKDGTFKASYQLGSHMDSKFTDHFARLKEATEEPDFRKKTELLRRAAKEAKYPNEKSTKIRKNSWADQSPVRVKDYIDNIMYTKDEEDLDKELYLLEQQVPEDVRKEAEDYSNKQLLNPELKKIKEESVVEAPKKLHTIPKSSSTGPNKVKNKDEDITQFINRLRGNV